MAVAQARHAPPYPAGECHPVLVFLRQLQDAEHDFDTAEALLQEAGWTEIDFTKAGILPADAYPQMDPAFGARYRQAMQDGVALLVYDTVVRPAPTAAGAKSS